MRRTLLMVALGAGAVAGFASGFAHLHHGGFCRHGTLGHYGRQNDFEQHVAETCAEAALRVSKTKNTAGTPP